MKLNDGAARASVICEKVASGESNEVVVVQIGVPPEELANWRRDLDGLAVITSPSGPGPVSSATDTLVIALWSSPLCESLEAASRLSYLRQEFFPFATVVGVFLDPDKATALELDSVKDLPSLSWLREISDMVVVSSDSRVLVELVTTFAEVVY